MFKLSLNIKNWIIYFSKIINNNVNVTVAAAPEW